MTALQHLDMKNTTLESFDDRGLSNLSRATKADITEVQGDRSSQRFLADHSYTPIGMSLLTNLARLKLTCNLRTAGPFFLAWVSELTTLQDLYIRYTNIGSGIVETLACLSSLTRKVVSGFDHLADASPVLNLDFSWSSLTALKHFILCDSKFAMGPGTASPLRLQRLQAVAFYSSVP